jgi:ectoine hydroxylase-related dioxygenase (phytanoyl-CoA dioxygenase family)
LTIATGVCEHQWVDHAQQLRELGYTVVAATHTPEQIARFRAALEQIHRRYGAPAPYDPSVRTLDATVLINPTGFVITQLLAMCPELAGELISPRVAAVVRELLGDDAVLELTGANICDAGRPFFSWHNHIGGIDVEDYRARSDYPRFERSQRVIVVTYLDDIHEAGGELRALPRAITEPTPPPHDQMTDTWPGQVRLAFEAGSTLIFEQCTWHCVMPKQTPGQRMFLGAYFKSSEAPKTSAVDESLVGFSGGGELLQSLLPR